MENLSLQRKKVQNYIENIGIDFLKIYSKLFKGEKTLV